MPVHANSLGHSERLEHGVNGIGVKADLELSEQLVRDGGDVRYARHRQQDALVAP